MIPAGVALLLRINAAILFMSLCLGEVLVQFVANDATSFASAVSPTGNMSQTTIRLVLLLAPVVLTAIFMFHSVGSGAKALINILPAIAMGLLLALLVEPLLPHSMINTLQHSNVWHQFSQAQTVIVLGGALFSLLFLWTQRAGLGRSGHSHHAKHH